MSVNDRLFRWLVAQFVQPAWRARRATGCINNEIGADGFRNPAITI
jgi:hypothetical protein